MPNYDMSKKIDVYMKDEGHYTDDLRRQEAEWRDNLFLPYASCYTIAYRSIKEKIVQAEKEKKAHEKRLKDITDTQIAVCLFFLDIATASTLSKLTGAVSRIQSKKAIDFFLTDGRKAGDAAIEFLRQGDTFLDVVIGNLATKSSDLVKDKVVADNFKKAMQKSVPKIKTAVVNISDAVTDPQVYQNDLMIRLGKSINAVGDMYVDAVRDVSDLSDESRRLMLTWFTTLPIVRPPTHSFPTNAMSGSMEVLLWCNIIFREAQRTVAGAKAKKKETPFILAQFDRHLGQKMNDCINRNTRYHLAASDVRTGDLPPAQYNFRGIVYKTHMPGLKKIVEETGKSLASIVTNLHT